MSRFKSTLLRAGLLAGLLSFGTGAAFAEAPNADIRNGVQPPPPVDQRMALVIGNSALSDRRRSSPIPATTRNAMSQLLNWQRASRSPQATDLTRKRTCVRVVAGLYRQGRRARPRTPSPLDLLCRSRRADRGRELSASGRCAKSRRRTISTCNSHAAGRPDGHAGLHSKPDAHRRARRLPQQSVSRRSTRRPDVAWRIVDAPNGVDRRLFDRAGHPKRRMATGNHSPVYVGVPEHRHASPNLPIEQLFKRVTPRRQPCDEPAGRRRGKARR